MGLFRRNKVWWMTFIHQGQQVRRSTGTTDKRLAEAILGKVRVKIVEAGPTDASQRPYCFNDMMDRYLKMINHQGPSKPTAWTNNASRILRSAFGSLNLAQVTPKLCRLQGEEARRPSQQRSIKNWLGSA